MPLKPIKVGIKYLFCLSQKLSTVTIFKSILAKREIMNWMVMNRKKKTGSVVVRHSYELQHKGFKAFVNNLYYEYFTLRL